MSETLATYTLEIRGVRNSDGSLPKVELLPGFIRETEENLTELLKGGYQRWDLWVLIKEWDAEEGPHSATDPGYFTTGES